MIEKLITRKRKEVSHLSLFPHHIVEQNISQILKEHFKNITVEESLNKTFKDLHILKKMKLKDILGSKFTLKIMNCGAGRFRLTAILCGMLI